MDVAQRVAERILSFCRQEGITPNALAKRAGVPISTVRNIVNANGGSKNAGILTIKKLCDGMGISLTDFFDTDMFRTTKKG